jgi:hypothetical protein
VLAAPRPRSMGSTPWRRIRAMPLPSQPPGVSFLFHSAAATGLLPIDAPPVTLSLHLPPPGGTLPPCCCARPDRRPWA